jgi:predicted DNA-binding antitoxin AbrB/MazE fold protein
MDVTTVQGIYDNGIVRLLEPVAVSEPCTVKVVFDKTECPKHTEAQKAALAVIGLLEDLTPDERQLFDEALQRQSWFGPHRELDS